MSREPTMYDFKGELVEPFETDKAWRFAPDDAEAVLWLPKSQCHWKPDDGEAIGHGGTMSIPEWLCQKLNLVP